MTGIEGRVELSGYKAVVAMFLRWTLERRGEDGSGQPIWTLRASMSFQKDSYLGNPKMEKKIFIKSPGFGAYEVVPVPGEEMTIENETQIVVQGVTLCRVEEQPR